MTKSNFTVLGQDKNTRIGKLSTRHGTISTPHFMPVVTRNGSNTIGPYDYHRLGASSEDIFTVGNEGVICNSLLAYFDPGIDVIEKHGGIHEYLGCACPVFTDSGGFQASNQSPLTALSTEGGLDFFDPYSNSNLFLTPKKSMQIQQSLGCDVALVLDDLVEYDSTRKRFQQAFDRTLRWAEECLKFHTDPGQMLFGISQGGAYSDLRGRSAKLINSLGFDGVAIGGIAVCRDQKTRIDAVSIALSNISQQKVRYVMGIGNPIDILLMVDRGVDLFDAAYPSIAATRGQAITSAGLIHFSMGDGNDDEPLDKHCECFVCKRFSKREIAYQLNVQPENGICLLQHHNLHFITEFMRELRRAIKQRRFAAFKRDFIARFQMDALNAIDY